MNIVRVIGIGSPFGDDQLGWRVAELLKQDLQLLPYIDSLLDIQISDRPGLALLTAMNNLQYLYLIDALKTQDNQAGRIYRMYGETISENDEFLSTHGFGVVAALKLAKALQQMPANVIIYAIEIDGTHDSLEISPLIQAACQNLAGQISRELLNKLSSLNYA